jgi:hypothetical protein
MSPIHLIGDPKYRKGTEMTKDEAIRRHAQVRAMQRFGIRLTDDLHDALVTKFKRKRGCHKRVSCRVWIFRTQVLGPKIDVVYDRKLELIVTFLKVREEK